MLEGKTWEDDLGELEDLRFEPANQENGIQELPDDEIRRVWYGTLEKRDANSEDGS